MILRSAALSFSVGLLGGPESQAAIDTRTTPRVQLIFVNKQGKSVPLDWPTKVWWDWRSVRGQAAMQEPVLRVSVTPSRKSRILKITNPQFEGRIEGDRLEISTQSIQANARLTVMNAAGQQLEFDFGVLVVSPTPEAIVHPSCGSLDISSHPRESEPGRGITANYLYHAIWCEKSPTGANLHVIRSRDASFQRGSVLPEKSPHPRADLLRVAFPAKPVTGANKIGDYTVATLNGRGKVVYDINYSYAKRLSFFFGIGGTTMTYTQTESSTMSVNQYAATVKGGVAYQLLPGKLDLGLSGYANVAAFGTTFQGLVGGNTASPAMFLGVNGRVGYTLPFRLETKVRMLAGWYFWSMGVASANYGLAQLVGPQVNLAVFRATPGSRAWALYVKFAPIIDSGRMILGNRELAVGGSYQVTSPKARLPIAVTLDLSDLALTNVNSVSAVGLRTASLGLQLNL